ncbi:hypothetical protein KAR91_83725 [Candidatus Pacearchaeota archaeon]|nr:hypothetical protein [Candidatus Pacearchaeota archaeon]
MDLKDALRLKATDLGLNVQDPNKIYCPYCGKEARNVGGKKIYPHRKDLYSLRFYICENCNAYTGTHRDSGLPKGTLADASLRERRKAAHYAFDAIWKDGLTTRRQAYALLAKLLGISKDACHIGFFKIPTCDQVCHIAEIIKSKLKTAKSAAYTELFEISEEEREELING